jgi:hypothetical protein
MPIEAQDQSLLARSELAERLLPEILIPAFDQRCTARSGLRGASRLPGRHLGRWLTQLSEYFAVVSRSAQIMPRL